MEWSGITPRHSAPFEGCMQLSVFVHHDCMSLHCSTVLLWCDRWLVCQQRVWLSDGTCAAAQPVSPAGPPSPRPRREWAWADLESQSREVGHSAAVHYVLCDAVLAEGGVTWSAMRMVEDWSYYSTNF